ncbi:bifunctional UDP-sugar hydrolase/5'-nucleotidase [uncultured Vibrio sp.]|uniref:bifunctional metallophosphatase/5'-nucleotidase n=1 Tax=uncultured Vibrio sp. TaxID=114054 RepID=UPI00260B2B97|nr:bifunctional UDP-sugar hydrolase/5'-nucleotidase [uncultured Vibrio sp.]
MKKTLLSTLIFVCASPLQAKDLTILYTNDLHAKHQPYIAQYVDEKNEIGGFANIASYVESERKVSPSALFLDAGDYFAGSTVDSLTDGEATIDIMNHMGYDAVSVGNHEFDYGWDNMLVRFSKAEFDILLGNVFFEDTETLVWKNPYQIIEKDGVKFGVIGIHGEFAFDDTVSHEMRQNIEARDEAFYTQKYIDQLKPQVDVVILLVHEGTPARQSSFGASDVKRALNKDIELAKQLSGLDVLITGHAHVGTPEPIEVNDTLIVSTDGYGINVGKLVLDFNEKTRTISGYNFELNTIYDKDWERHPATQKAVDKWSDVIEEATSEVIATTDELLTRSYGESSRLGNLAADAILARFPDSVAAFTNSGGIREDIAAGDITLGDVINSFPFPNYPAEMTLTGEQLYSLLEHAAGLTNGVMQSSSSVYYEYNSSLPVGERIVTATINGEPIVNSQSYRIATNNFFADGGDGFKAFASGKDRVNIPNEYLYTTVSDYLKTNNALDNINEVRIVDSSNK